MNRLDLEKLMKDSQPSWLKDGKGIRGDQEVIQEYQLSRARPATVTRTHNQIPFPEPENTAVTQQNIAAAGNDRYSFQLRLDAKEAATVDILVTDGEINNEFPTGMTGADDYVLTLSVDGTEIWAVVTYEEEISGSAHTLEITSRSLDFGAAVPDSIFGTLYIPIGYVDWELDGDGNISNVFPHNRQCGDINIGFTVGNHNGVPAVIPVRLYDDPVEIPLT